jgi:hypothetical protein
MRTGNLLRLPVLFSLLLILGCGRSGSSSGDVDTAMLRTAGGDVMLADGARLPYEITSQRYAEWERARRGLRGAKLGLTMSIDPLRVTERDIQKAVDYFERNGRARRIIEDAGLSVRDYVLTTIVLEQQMAVASGRWGDREAPRAPSRPVVSSESLAAEFSRDSARRVRVDTVQVRDTVIQPVDTVVAPPDTTSPPDTTAAPPAAPDSRL